MLRVAVGDRSQEASELDALTGDNADIAGALYYYALYYYLSPLCALLLFCALFRLFAVVVDLLNVLIKVGSMRAEQDIMCTGMPVSPAHSVDSSRRAQRDAADRLGAGR